MGIKPNIKEYDEDDWANNASGVGWAKKDTFFDNETGTICIYNYNHTLRRFNLGLKK